MARRYLILFVFGVFVALPPTLVNAEDYINVNGLYKVVYAKFKPLCARRSLQILNEHFEKADKAIGRNVIPFTFQTGEWDHVVYIPIQMSADGYDTIPPESEWRAALYKQEGSKAPRVNLVPYSA